MSYNPQELAFRCPTGFDGTLECNFASIKVWSAPKPSDPPAQLYDVVADPAEEYNLYTKHPEIVQRLLLTLQKIQFEEGYKPNRPEQLEEQLNIKQLNTLLRGESK